jgi:hypothetical protein
LLVFGDDVLVYGRRILGIHSGRAFLRIFPDNVDWKSSQIDDRSEADVLFELRKSGTANLGHYFEPIGTKGTDFISVQRNEHGRGNPLSKRRVIF